MISKTLLILIPILVAILLYNRHTEVIFKPLCTLIHEFGHAIIVLLLGGKVLKIQINPDFSGSCVSRAKGRLRSIIASLSGYPTPLIVGYFSVKCVLNNNTRLIFYILTILCIIALLLFIRNSFGVIWTLCFTAVNILFIYLPSAFEYRTIFVYICACILLIDGIVSSFTLLIINLKGAKKAGDSYILQTNTHLPALIFTLCFVVFNCYMIFKTLEIIIPIFK